MAEISCKDIYDPFSCSKYIWYCCNGNTVKHFERFNDMMDFLLSPEGKGFWPL